MTTNLMCLELQFDSKLLKGRYQNQRNFLKIFFKTHFELLSMLTSMVIKGKICFRISESLRLDNLDPFSPQNVIFIAYNYIDLTH